MHRLFRPEATSDKGLVEQAQDRTAPKGMLFHHAAEGKPLATPWQVASLRAGMLATFSLPDGYIVDCACGSGVQLAAYATTLRRAVLGVELEEGRARASAVNLKTVVEHHRASDADWYRSSIVLSGDGTDPQGVFSVLGEEGSIAFLHLDPARPRNSRTHDLSEMQPPLSAVLKAWAPFFAADVSPSILLDLSPRLTTAQRQEVEAKVDDVWPGLPRTWEWTSRGRGRVDRLALWLGGVADTKASKRFVRVPPSLGQKARLLSTSSVSEGPLPLRHPPKRGEYVSILDAALMESGLMDAWLSDVLPDTSYRWGVVSGRRPQLHHDQPLRLNSEDALLVQASGRVVGLIRMKLDVETVDALATAAIEHNFSSLTLRLDLDPESQPRLQGSLDRQLRRRGGEREGFLALHPDGEVLLLCVSQTYPV
jgi:hypothetical protein